MERDVKKRIKWYDDAIEHNAAYEDKDSKEALAQAREKDRRSKSAVYMPHHPVVATDFNGSLMVFDRHRVGKDGETALVIFRYADVEGGYRSFTHFVEAALKDARSEVEGLRRKKPRN